MRLTDSISFDKCLSLPRIAQALGLEERKCTKPSSCPKQFKVYEGIKAFIIAQYAKPLNRKEAYNTRAHSFVSL